MLHFSKLLGAVQCIRQAMSYPNVTEYIPPIKNWFVYFLPTRLSFHLVFFRIHYSFAGIPGITNVTNIDLQESDKIQVILNQTDLIDVQVTLSKGIVLGLSDTEVQNPL